jgi:ABC-type Mn2+/Zn2+ transport system permease subunit
MQEALDTLYYMRYALMVAPVIGATCALLSVYVVLRRMALISEGVSHAGFGGIAIAVLLGYFFPGLDNAVAREIITGIFCLITAMLIGYASRRKHVSEDSAIGIFLVASIALGILLLAVRTALPRQPGQTIPVSVESLLFGDLVSTGPTDLLIAACAMVIVFAIIGSLYYQFLYTTLDEEMARINGVNTRLINTLLLMMISLVIVVCVRMVGFLMVTALTIIPGATANMLSRRFGGVMLAALVIGTFGTAAAATLTAVHPFSRYPSGALIVLVLFAIFVCVWTYRHFFKPKAVDVQSGSALPEPHDHAHPSPPSAFGHGHVH